MHSLIIGQTESGKSTLAKLLAKSYSAKGRKVAVLDPMYDPGWGKVDWKGEDIEALREWMESNRSAFVFVDESGQYFNEGNDMSNAWLATRSRHYGHSVHFISQRAIQIPKTMRDQCSRLFLFTSSRSDGKIHSEEWNKEVLETCNTLPKLHFYYCDRYDICQHMQIVDYREIKPYDSGHYSDSSRISNNSIRGGKVDRKKGSKG